MTLIDAHTHLFDPAQIASRAEIAEEDAGFAEIYGDSRAKMADAPRLGEALARAGLDAAVAAGFAFSSAREIVRQNEYLLSAAKADPRIIPLATANPALRGWETGVRHALAGGVRGFGELRPHNQGWDPLGAEAHRLYGLAGDANAVLLWHVSEEVGHQYPGKRGGISAEVLWRIVVEFPELRMIAAHMGAALSFSLQMPEVREALSNVWFDTAAFGLLYDDTSVARLVDLAGPERVLFGSDYPLLSPRRQLQRVTALLPGGVAQAVCGGNAESLFSDKRDS
ncbi:MAG: amidohydrolase family protein [Anaerolineaceae bacterium]